MRRSSFFLRGLRGFFAGGAADCRASSSSSPDDDADDDDDDDGDEDEEELTLSLPLSLPLLSLLLLLSLSPSLFLSLPLLLEVSLLAKLPLAELSLLDRFRDADAAAEPPLACFDAASDRCGLLLALALALEPALLAADMGFRAGLPPAEPAALRAFLLSSSPSPSLSLSALLSLPTPLSSPSAALSPAPLLPELLLVLRPR